MQFLLSYDKSIACLTVVDRLGPCQSKSPPKKPESDRSTLSSVKILTILLLKFSQKDSFKQNLRHVCQVVIGWDVSKLNSGIDRRIYPSDGRPAANQCQIMDLVIHCRGYREVFRACAAVTANA
jgi:hypothetical protein